MTSIAFRVLASSDSNEAWFEDAAAADAAVAERLRIPADQLDALRRRITVDPVVVRRDGARWRSRQVWSFRNASASVRVFEMLLIDEELYDHRVTTWPWLGRRGVQLGVVVTDNRSGWQRPEKDIGDGSDVVEAGVSAQPAAVRGVSGDRVRGTEEHRHRHHRGPAVVLRELRTRVGNDDRRNAARSTQRQAGLALDRRRPRTPPVSLRSGKSEVES